MSEKYPAMSKIDHLSFCNIEGWSEVLNSRGKGVSHHRTFELSIWSGLTLRTRISHPLNKVSYGKNIQSRVLNLQLQVSAKTFWDCVKHKTLPDRGQPQVSTGKGMPLYLFRELQKLGATTSELDGLDHAGAKLLLEKLVALEAGD